MQGWHDPAAAHLGRAEGRPHRVRGAARAAQAAAVRPGHAGAGGRRHPGAGIDHSPNLAAMFDGLYFKGYAFNALAWDGGPAIRARMRCVGINLERGLQITRPWSEPLRRAVGDGICRLYRPTPRHQRIQGVTNRYVLAADEWEPVAVPEGFKKRQRVGGGALNGHGEDEGRRLRRQAVHHGRAGRR